MRSVRFNAAPAAALLLLCLLWAMASLRSDLLPRSVSETDSSPLLNQAVILALFAVLAAVAAFVQKTRWPQGPALLPLILVGATLFALPSALIEFARGNLDDSTRVALFSLVPVFAVVLDPHLGSASQSPPRAALVSALVAVAGTLFVFPVELPHSSGPTFAFCAIIAAVASVAAASCVAVNLARVQSQLPLSCFAAIVAGSAATPLAVAGFLLKPHARPLAHIDVWAIPDLLALALLFWLMRRMSGVRMTTRFLIAPLVANLIALAFLRPGVQARAWLGLLLIALGSAWLLFAPEDEPDKSGSPLGITH